jgi:CRISPR/Cas system-associated exonuclease Cas4 (RecB family)
MEYSGAFCPRKTFLRSGGLLTAAATACQDFVIKGRGVTEKANVADVRSLSLYGLELVRFFKVVDIRGV